MVHKLRVGILFVAAFIFALTSVQLGQVAEVSAVNHTGTLYFSGAGRTLSHGNCQVIPGGIYGVNGGSSDQLKESFIATIAALAMNSDSSACSGTGGGGASLKQLGARYIVQTMRGQGVGASYNLGWGELDDWAARIRNPEVTVSRQIYGFSKNTATYWNCGVPGSACLDVGQFDEAPTSAESIVFYRNGAPIYAVKIECGNPVGDLNEIPLQSLNFQLDPTISVNPSISEGSTNVSLTGSVNNSGLFTTPPVQWQTTTFRLPPGVGIPGGGISPAPPTAVYGNGATVVQSGSGQFPRGVSGVGLNQQTLTSYPVGTRICFTLSFQPYRHDNASWSHSAPSCVTIAKKPKVQVLGGDLVVGRGTANNPAATSNVVASSTFTSATGLNYGSWGEYAIIPSGTVRGMASGAGYASGAGSSDLCSLSLLTLSNRVANTFSGTSTCQAAQIGKYKVGSTAPNPGSRFPVPTTPAQILSAATPSQDIHALSPGLVYTTSRPTLSISSSAAFEAGRWVVLNAPNTTVTITSDINYTTAPVTSINAIPQVVIIAKNIIVADSVKNIDSWLIASGGSLVSGSTAADGRLNTCGAGGVNESTLPNANQCTNKLTVNGPIMANHLILRRTAGAGVGAAAGDPAEVFNLRADAYIWSSAYSPSNGRVPTVSTKELPPRF